MKIKDHSLALDIRKRHEKREKKKNKEKKTERLVRSSKKKSNKEKRTMPCNNNSEVFQEDSEQ